MHFGERFQKSVTLEQNLHLINNLVKSQLQKGVLFFQKPADQKFNLMLALTKSEDYPLSEVGDYGLEVSGRTTRIIAIVNNTSPTVKGGSNS